MLIEIRGVGFVNKGAELMLYATLQKLKERYPTAMFVMTPTHSGGDAPYIKRGELGMLQKAWLWRFGFQFGDLLGLIPETLRERYGIVLDKEIDIVLDAAGFAYSDQWGDGSSKELARASKRWKKRGTTVVLLPQALGPYSSRAIKNSMKDVVENVDLIFAREPSSYDYLTGVVGERDKIKIAPDFTNLLKGVVPSDFDFDNHRFCIIPNHRMIEKTTARDSEAYLPLLTKCARYLLAQDASPFSLVHEGAGDQVLAEKIEAATDGNVPIVNEADPLRIKGILGMCEGVIGSRFHGLVSALSQGVPSLAIGWSHKYRMLFKEYGFEAGLLDVSASDEEIEGKIDMIVDPASRVEIKGTIEAKAEELKTRTEEMWEEVFAVLPDPT